MPSDWQMLMQRYNLKLKHGETKKINDKASANAKLKALGLTDDEIEALK